MTRKESPDVKRKIKSLSGKIFIVMCVFALVQMVLTIELFSVFFEKYLQGILKSYRTEHLSVAKENINKNLEVAKTFLESKYEEFNSGLWREEIENQAYRLLRTLNVIYESLDQGVSEQKKKEKILQVIKANSFFDEFIFVLDNYANIILRTHEGQIKAKENKELFQQAFKVGKTYRSGYVEGRLYSEEPKRTYHLTGYVTYFEPFEWVIFYAKNTENVFRNFRDAAIYYIQNLKSGKFSQICLYDELKKTYYCNSSSVSIPKSLQERVHTFVQNTKGTEIKMLNDWIYMGVKEYKPFKFKIFAVLDISHRLKEVQSKIQAYKEQFSDLRKTIIAVNIIIFLAALGFFVMYLKHVGHIVRDLYNNLLEAVYNQKIFLATVSHEIRTPLNGIIGFLDLLIQTPLNEEQRRYVEKSLASSYQLLELINDVLDTAKIQAGQIELIDTEFSLEEVINEVVLSLSSEKRPNVKVKLKVYELPYYLIGDAKRVTQIFYNLISNAFKFTLEGYVEIGIKGIEEVGDKVIVTAYVKDTGIGIPANKQNRLFKPFSQIYTKLHEKVSGTGLGLYITQKLVQLMGGEIWFESTEGKGTTFYIKLPLKKGKLKDKTKEVKDQKPFEKIDLSNLRVLIAEDVPVNQMLIKTTLEKFFNIKDIDVATNGKEVLEKTKQKDYDLILMDLKMPEMDGLTTTQELRKRGIKTPIYMLTADAFKETQIKAERAGANGYLTKPIDKEKLKEVLQTLLK